MRAAGWRRQVGALSIAFASFGLTPVAHAASVNLTASVNAPQTGSTLVPFTVSVTYGNSTTPPTTATNALLSTQLPSGLYNVQVVSDVAAGGATCPGPASFSGVPTGATSSTVSVTATILSLPSAGTCTVTYSVTPLSAQADKFIGEIDPGSSDTLSSANNISVGNTTVGLSNISLGVSKTILSPMVVAAGGTGTGVFGQPITYAITFYNNSTLSIPLGLTPNSLYDQESDQSSVQPYLPSNPSFGYAPVTNISCVPSGPTTCPVVTTSRPGTYSAPVDLDTSNVMMGPGSSFTITYSETYQPNVCGQMLFYNSVDWIGPAQYGNITWTPGTNFNGIGTAQVNLTFPPQRACVAVNITPSITKTLDSITDAAGNVKPAPANITDDGDTAHFTVTIVGDPNVALNIQGSDTTAGIPDQYHVANSFYPALSVLQSFQFDSCTITGAGSGSTCPDWGNGGVYPAPIASLSNVPPGTLYLGSSTPQFVLGANQTITLKATVKYTGLSSAACVNLKAPVANYFTGTVLGSPPPADGDLYTGNTFLNGTTKATPYDVLPTGKARCVDIVANKTVTPANPNAGDPLTFTLDYTNNTISTTANAINPVNPVTNVTIADTLGADFTATSVACAVKSGTATAPTVTLVNITGANHTFSAVIPSMADGAAIRCTITGSRSLPGSYTNTTTATVAGSDITGEADPFGNNASSVAFGIVGPQVGISKSVTPTGAVAAGSTLTYTVTATNGGVVPADGTVVQDPIPAGITAFTSWTCTPSGGAVCPNATGSGAINETIATFPAGAQVVYSITAQVSAFPPSATIANTASAVPLPNSSCLPGNTAPPCTATTSNTVPPKVSIAKTSSVAGTIVAGGSVTYTVTTTNTGAVPADGTVIADAMAPGISSQTWTCSATGGAACPHASGSGAIAETVAVFPSGSSVTYTIAATVSTTPPNPIANTATATPPTGGVCTPGDTAPPCTATATNPTAPPLVSVTKTSSVTGNLTPSGSVTYTVAVSNAGIVAADGTTVSDPLPAGISSATWSCAPSGGASCTASGSNAINDTLTAFPVGGTAVYTVIATISATPPSPVVNAVTAHPPTGGLCAPGNTPPPCTATVTNTTPPLISIAKTSSVTGNLTPGGGVTYVVTVANTGNVAADGTTVSDPLPVGISSATWTCTGSGGTICAANGTNAISDTLVAFPAGGKAVYTIVATVGGSLPATITNIARATPPNGGLCTPGNTPSPCAAAVSNGAPAQVSIAKTSSVAGNLTSGGSVTYTVTVTNTGSVAADGTSVSDPLPAGISSATWTCAATGGATCAATGSGAVADTLTTFPVAAQAVYTIIANVSATPPAVVTNTASATPPSGGTCAPGNTAPPCTATVSNPPAPQVSIAKTSSVSGNLTPGGSVTYTVTLTNTGSVAANGTTVSDPLPAGISSATWTCAAAGGATCSASGSGAVVDTLSAFPVGAQAVYTVIANVSATPPAVVTNTASTTPPSSGTCSPGNTPPPCAATVSNSVPPQISITKTTTATTLSPNGTINYLVTVTNEGGVSAAGTMISDPLPAGVISASWTCTGNGGAVCPSASGNGAINATLATFPPASSVVYSIAATVSATPPAMVTNIASATPPGGGLCAPGNTLPPCTASVSVPPVPVVGIAKTTSATAVIAGGSIVYQVTANNVGSIAAPNTFVADPIPTGIASQTWTCAASSGAACPVASGSGAVNQTIASFPAGGQVVYTVTATVSATPPGSITNIATITPPGGGQCQPCSATATVPTPDPPELSISKSANVAQTRAGGTIVYTVTVSNPGDISDSGSTISDPLPAGIASATWTCSASGGAACPNASGSGAINQTIVSFPPGASLVYTVTAIAAANVPSSIVNTAQATPPAGGVCMAGKTLPPCMATVTTPVTTPTDTAPVPMLSDALQALLALMLAGAALGADFGRKRTNRAGP